MRILKHRLNGPDTTIETRGPVLSAALQVDGEDYGVVVWAIDDESRPAVKRRAVALNTGDLFDLDLARMRFIDTVTTPRGIVWHVLVEAA